MSSEENVKENQNDSSNLEDSNATEEIADTDVIDASEESTTELSAENEVEALKAELDKYKKEYLYLRAEFDNYRKRMLEERSQTVKYGGERVLRDLVSVLDNFDLALKTSLTEENMSSYEQGVQMIRMEFFSALERNGVTEVPAEGQDFDPAVHEALGNEETDKVEPGKVCTVYKKAFKLHDKLLRPAQVTVAKEKSDA